MISHGQYKQKQTNSRFLLAQQLWELLTKGSDQSVRDARAYSAPCTPYPKMYFEQNVDAGLHIPCITSTHKMCKTAFGPTGCLRLFTDQSFQGLIMISSLTRNQTCVTPMSFTLCQPVDSLGCGIFRSSENDWRIAAGRRCSLITHNQVSLRTGVSSFSEDAGKPTGWFTGHMQAPWQTISCRYKKKSCITQTKQFPQQTPPQQKNANQEAPEIVPDSSVT